jgi:tRNA(fMet)-specific endonuclease VapC
MKYMLDTNICIYAIANRSMAIVEKLRELNQHDISVSVIVASELAYGVAKSRWYAKNRDTLNVFLSSLKVESMSDEVMWHYASLRFHLERIGKRIGDNDQWIAAHALATDSILVTNNLDEFERVPGLIAVNWVQS